MSQDQPNPVGRPTLYREEYVEEAYKLTLFGATLVQLAENFNVSLSTIDKWMSERGEFSSAVRIARQQADSMVENSLYRRAIGYDKDGKHYPASDNAISLWLRNRQPDKWRDKVEHEHKVVEFKRIERNIIDVTPENEALEAPVEAQDDED